MWCYNNSVPCVADVVPCSSADDALDTVAGSAATSRETIIELCAAEHQQSDLDGYHGGSYWDVLLQPILRGCQYQRLRMAPPRRSRLWRSNWSQWLAARRQQGIAHATLCAAGEQVVKSALHLGAIDPLFVTRLVVVEPSIDGLWSYIEQRYGANTLTAGGDKQVRFFQMRHAVDRSYPLYVIEEHLLDEHLGLLQQRLHHFLMVTGTCPTRGTVSSDSEWHHAGNTDRPGRQARASTVYHSP